MKNSVLHRGAPWVLALVLLANYAAVVFGVPAILSQFVDFKIEMPALTILAIGLSRLLTSPTLGFVLAAVMLSLTFALAIREKWAWGIGFGLTLIFGLSLLSLVLPFIAIANSLGEPGEMARSRDLLMPILLTAIPALVPPLAFLALRRAYWPKPDSQNRTSLAPDIPRGV